MAECVLWMARCRSFCNTHISSAFCTALHRHCSGFIWECWRLTIMLSRAHLASQQLRNTGINRFLSGGQKIWHRERIRLYYQMSFDMLFWICFLPLWWKGQYLTSPTGKTPEISAPIYYPENNIQKQSVSNISQSKMQELDTSIADSEQTECEKSIIMFTLCSYAHKLTL